MTRTSTDHGHTGWRQITPLRASLGLLLLSALSLAGCGPGSAAGSTGASAPAASGATAPGASGATAPAASGATDNGESKPCVLLTDAQVAAAMGQSLGAGVDKGVGNCTWSSTDFATSVSLTVGNWETNFATAQVRNTTAAPIPVSGLGDEAFYINVSSVGPLLYVRKGKNGFGLSVVGPNISPSNDQELAKEKILSALILPRL